MTGASVNFKAVKSAGHAVAHASREVAPTYLLPPDKSMGTVVVLDDAGKVSQVIDAKMALASPRAKVDKRYSPVWEGILNLRRPEPGEDADEYRAECSAVVTDWYKQYEAATGHKVLRVDVHLDEGHMVDGEAVLNAHAHVIADRTNDLGRVIKLDRKQLRALQTMTAEVTNLERGKSSKETRRKHISHHAYKHLAERGRLETQQQVGDLKATHGKELDVEKSKTARIQKLFADDTPVISSLKAELAQLKAQIEADYKANRAAMVASKTATQADYKALKEAKEKEIAALAEKLKTTQEKVEKMDEYTKELKADLAASEVKIAQLLIEKAEAIEAKVKSGEKSPAVLVTAEGHRDAAAKLMTSQSNTMTPDQVIPLGPNARAKLRAEQMALEAAKTAQEPPKQPEVPIPSPHPEKQPVDLFKRLQESWDRMIEWITGNSGKRVEVNTQSSEHFGPVVQLDDLHAVQRTGRDLFAVHQLDDLDKVPALDDPLMVIRYHDGKGVVHGQLGKPGVQR